MVLLGILFTGIILLIVSKWWVDGTISGTELILISGVYGSLVTGFFVLLSNRQTVATTLILLFLIATAAYAIYRQQKFGIKQFYKEKIKSYQLVIEADPANSAARSLLAKAYYDLGDLDSAIAAMELMMQVSPTSHKESYVLKQWRAERELRDSHTIVCKLCHSKNIWGQTTCIACLQPLVYKQSKPQRSVDELRRWITYWIMGASWLVLAVVAFVMFSVTTAVFVIVCSTLAVTGWMLISASKG